MNNVTTETSETIITGIPSTLGECADKLMAVKLERSKLTKKDDVLKEYAGEIKDYALKCLQTQGLTSSSGLKGCITIANKLRYSISDKEAFVKHMFETQGYDLITCSVSSAAMNERVMNSEDVPGVGSFEQTLINLTKRK